MNGFPENDNFMFYFNDWIEEPSDPCPLGGKASHGQAISRTPKKIKSSYFRTSFVPLRGQHEFINAHRSGHNILQEIKSFYLQLICLYFPHFSYFHTISKYRVVDNLVVECSHDYHIDCWYIFVKFI